MARVLIVEDEPELAGGLRDNFEFDGDEVRVASDGVAGLAAAREWRPVIIVLDVMLPGKSGFDVCKELRGEGNVTPILMLTARGQEIDKVLGLELGADDYLTKPFSVRELLARVRAILRRTGEKGSSGGPCRMGRLILDFEHYTARDDTGEVPLTHREFELLKYLRDHKGKTVSRDALLQHVWGYESFPTTRTIDTFIARIRKRLEPDPNHPRHVLTAHGIGYKYIE
ncbi:MAG: response regulator [Chitinivibrionales bacterium]|nr:response regulator [Chitinivibrionales bacterium]